MKYSLKNIKGRRWVELAITVVVIALLVVVGGVFVARQVYDNNLRPVASNQKSVTITIPTGTPLTEVADILKEQGVIKSTWAFMHYVSNKQADNDIKAGTYELSPSYSVPQIVAIITEGKVATDLITILPGQRLGQIRKALIANGFSASSVDRALDPGLYKNHPALVDKPRKANLEGYLYPESFQKTADTTPEDIVRLSLDEMQKRLTPSIRGAIADKGLSVYEGLILGSMAEQEADNLEDRAKVIQVFLKRMKMDMKLESDVTALYGASIHGKKPSLTYDSAYNTYLYGGLPPTPISNVSASSLQAVARPASTDYLYFVAGDDGTVHFSRTRQEHEALVDKYCHENC